MVLKLLVLMTAFVGMVSTSGSRSLGDGETDGHGHGQGYGSDEVDPDAGWRGFGKVVSVVTVIAVIVFIAILIMMFFSLGGYWEDELADPPV